MIWSQRGIPQELGFSTLNLHVYHLLKMSLPGFGVLLGKPCIQRRQVGYITRLAFCVVSISEFTTKTLVFEIAVMTYPETFVVRYTILAVLLRNDSLLPITDSESGLIMLYVVTSTLDKRFRKLYTL